MHFKNSDGYEEWYKYEHNKTYSKDSKGVERWTEFDEIGKLIHMKNSIGFEKWVEYDENGECISLKQADGVFYKNTFNKEKNILHYVDFEGLEYWEKTYYYDLESINNFLNTL